MKFELCLLDRNSRLIAREPFWAETDLAAQQVASLVLEACKDVAAQYEVWSGQVLVAEGYRKRGLFTTQDIIEQRQINVIDLEDRLQRGFTAIAVSHRLLRATDKLRKRGLL